MDPNKLREFEESGAMRPSLWRDIYTFPVTLLVVLCVPLGFLLGAVYSGLLVGMSGFKRFAARMAVEGLIREMKRQQRNSK